MKYSKEGDKEFLKNGNSYLRVQNIHTMPDPYNKGRVCRIFAVQEVIVETNRNPIERGSQIALSFPPEKANAAYYDWHREQGEPCQIPFNIQIKKKNIIQ